MGAAPDFPQGRTLGAAVVIPRVGLGCFRKQLVIAARYSHQLHLILASRAADERLAFWRIKNTT